MVFVSLWGLLRPLLAFWVLGGMVGGLVVGKCLYGLVMESCPMKGVRGLRGKEGVAPVAG